MPKIDSLTLNDFAQMVRMSAEGKPTTSIAKTTGGIDGGMGVGEPALTVVENAGAAAIPGEEPIDDRELTRDDSLGELIDNAFGASNQVAKNIGESADKLRELFERNKEDAEVKERRLESVLKAEAAKSSGGDERLDAMLREAELKV